MSGVLVLATRSTAHLPAAGRPVKRERWKEVRSMRLGVRDVVATVLVAPIAIPYIGYLVNGEMPFVRDPRGMAAVGLVLGVAAC
ncbi:hypothetical protein V1227_07620 [Lentzea sp. DG1S-22]|uniref:hypothetical protein n=1 Tax=Lentzea sp. DG1S-22 TaxID=3108822 RepID=UPI002E769A10|nr:hypothetical protein [Lentzea sp. DG1S-22]WVH82612.1 hypothetical protein V1227_07620 [Lentzea sp. DG1S-22]